MKLDSSGVLNFKVLSAIVVVIVVLLIAFGPKIFKKKIPVSQQLPDRVAVSLSGVPSMQGEVMYMDGENGSRFLLSGAKTKTMVPGKKQSLWGVISSAQEEIDGKKVSGRIAVKEVSDTPFKLDYVNQKAAQMNAFRKDILKTLNKGLDLDVVKGVLSLERRMTVDEKIGMVLVITDEYTDRFVILGAASNPIRMSSEKFLDKTFVCVGLQEALFDPQIKPEEIPFRLDSIYSEDLTEIK